MDMGSWKYSTASSGGFKRLEEEGFKIEGYIDKNADLLKNSFAGKPVILPQKLQNREKICVLICTIRPTTIKQIQQMCKKKKLNVIQLMK